MINTSDRTEILALFDADPEAALNEYCHEGLDVRPEHVVNDDGEEVLTGRHVAEICSKSVVADTRDDAVRQLAARVRTDIHNQEGPWGC